MDFLEYVKMCQEESDQETRQEKMCNGLIYKVEAGDTLYSISRKYRLRVRDIMRANPFVNVYNLQIGEELCIPVAPTPSIEGARPYVVRQGDTVRSILENNKVSFEELARLNRSVAALRLPVGMIILIPTRVQPRSMEPGPMQMEPGRANMAEPMRMEPGRANMAEPMRMEPMGENVPVESFMEN